MTARFFRPDTQEWYLAAPEYTYSDMRIAIHERAALLGDDRSDVALAAYPTVSFIDRDVIDGELVFTFRGKFWDIFRDVFELACQRVHINNRRKGFWPNNDCERGSLRLALYPDTHGRNEGEMLALMTSEHSEALDAVRAGGLDHKDDKLPHRSGFFTEICDAIIRGMDTLGGIMGEGGATIVEKVGYNDKSRGHLHGKKF